LRLQLAKFGILIETVYKLAFSALTLSVGCVWPVKLLVLWYW